MTDPKYEPASFPVSHPGPVSLAGSAIRPRCRWCRRPFDRRPGPGRPQEFCKRSCRQRDYESRVKAAEHGLDEADLVLARNVIDQLRDDIYVLQCAIEDVDRDLAGSGSPQDVSDALTWILAAARPLVQSALRAVGP